MTFQFEICRAAEARRWSPPSWSTSTPTREMTPAPLPDDVRDTRAALRARGAASHDLVGGLRRSASVE